MQAEGGMGGGGMMQCPMMSCGMGMFMGILGVLFLLAATAALMALAVYLIRRSGPRRPLET